jgi:hypothetical protein
MSRRDNERGPQGDHGQIGPQGPIGTPGKSWSWRGLPAARTFAFLLVVLVSVFAVYRINQGGIDDLRAVELRTCERVQFLRDQANGTNFLIFDTFKQIVDQQNKIIASGRLKGAALKQAKDSVKRSQGVVNTTVVTGPTDCHEATFNNSYKAPAPEFIARNGPHVAQAREHAAGIIRKARLQQPLYDASKQPQPRRR